MSPQKIDVRHDDGILPLAYESGGLEHQMLTANHEPGTEVQSFEESPKKTSEEKMSGVNPATRSVASFFQEEEDRTAQLIKAPPDDPVVQAWVLKKKIQKLSKEKRQLEEEYNDTMEHIGWKNLKEAKYGGYKFTVESKSRASNVVPYEVFKKLYPEVTNTIAKIPLGEARKAVGKKAVDSIVETTSIETPIVVRRRID